MVVCMFIVYEKQISSEISGKLSLKMMTGKYIYNKYIFYLLVISRYNQVLLRRGFKLNCYGLLNQQVQDKRLQGFI